ncbi:MAG: nucleotidyltransferase family protein [Melioribacteraceae bacterium]|nr:nucleotidyltransferase family protein [Melioribacteraceae bacterium]MCF8356289.1 nucleotidyltransferase family protein [Melioribacteraceae bacterium]MCF8394257.1 nucleotidyltransferase family protein [Melioribacteraceae bacterium]MCF8419978.1 nucleotidyltransferase family protein [Melioribacteraceae bacterium]
MDKTGIDSQQEKRLLKILKSHSWFMNALETVSKLKLPQWCIGAGVIRSIVFDYLENVPATPIRDVDVAYFNSKDTSYETDKMYESKLKELMPGIPWEVTNQAGVHLWYHKKFGYKVDPLKNIDDAVSTFPETCTCIGITKTEGRDITIIAPYGLDDLFNLIIRRNPKRIDIKTYNKRIKEKQYQKRWKNVKIIYETAE